METAGLVEQRRDGVHEHVNRVGYAHKVIKKKSRCKKRIQRFAPKVPMALQELYVSCKNIFKGPATVPSPCDVQKLAGILESGDSRITTMFNLRITSVGSTQFP